MDIDFSDLCSDPPDTGNSNAEDFADMVDDIMQESQGFSLTDFIDTIAEDDTPTPEQARADDFNDMIERANLNHFSEAVSNQLGYYPFNDPAVSALF